MSNDLPQHVEDAIQRTKLIIKNGDLQFLAHGMEGTLTTDRKHVFKYFTKGKDNFSHDQLDFIKRKVLKQRFKHIAYLGDVIEHNEEIIFVMEFHEGIEYSGGYLQQIREMLIELKQNSIGYRNICPKNLLVSKGQLLLCDLGHSFTEYNPREFLEMKKRSYLTYTCHSRSDLPFIMSQAIENPNIPALTGYGDFERYVDEGIEIYDDSTHLPDATVPLQLPLRHVSLLIKSSPIEWETIEFQIRHIVKQLNIPKQFNEVIVLTDDHKGPFLRQYAEPDYEKQINILYKLKDEGLIDRIIIAPSDEVSVRTTYENWFGNHSSNTHAENGQHIHTTLFGFDQCQTDFVLQLDSDCIIVRKDLNQDYLGEMLELFQRHDDVITIPFAIASDIDEIDKARSKPWRTEVRFSLINLNRLRKLLPLPNEVNDYGNLNEPWHRALDHTLATNAISSLRRGSNHTFFIHVPNDVKKDVNLWFNILKEAELGIFPPEQIGNVELVSDLGAWYPGRNEEYIFIIRGKDVDLYKLKRMFDSVHNQSMGNWGCVFIDAKSTNGMLEYIERVIYPDNQDKISIWRNWQLLTPLENTKIAISNLCNNPDSIIITLDADDCSIGNDVLTRLHTEYSSGADLTVGSMFRTDKQKDYPVDFKNPRETSGGNVWQHLRTFKKYLFDQIPMEYFRMDGDWIPHTEDWAFMLPMIDIAKSPRHIKEPLYYYEPSLDKSFRKITERERIIGEVLNKPSLSLLQKLIPPSSEPRYTTSLDLIEIDITYACNLKCDNCNRSCSQAPDNSFMTVEQIQKFLQQAEDTGRLFKRIRILGGEPLLHPDVIEILQLLIEYRDANSPETLIEVVTNGYGNKVNERIGHIPDGVIITNTHKTETKRDPFEPFNLAPRDITNFNEEDYSNACWVTSQCGFGLNMYGYYYCAVAAGIDRVLGLDIWIKNLPTTEDEFSDQKEILCSLCGHFLSRTKSSTNDRKQIAVTYISSSWRKTYDKINNTINKLC
jgi:hypothetical protein